VPCLLAPSIPRDASFARAPHRPVQQWVATWAAAPQEIPDDQAQHFDRAQTIRLIVHLTLGGHTLRLRISNLYGATSLHIGAAHVALRGGGAQIEAGTDRPLMFGTRRSVSIPSGESLVSDAISFDVDPEADLVVSLFLPDGAVGTTGHLLARQTNYAAAQTGDVTGVLEFPIGHSFRSWPFIVGVDVSGARPAAALVAFGDSLVDGDGSTTDANQRWPNLLAHRLIAAGEPLAVVNEGIIANRLLRGVAPEMRGKFGGIPGDAALDRFSRDVLDQAGVRCVIVRTGTNDLGFPGSFASVGESVSAADILAGYRQLAARAHARGLALFVTTIPPFEGAKVGPGYYSESKERVRQQVNARIRHGGGFEGYFDFDAVLRDPSDPARIAAQYDSGDHLHPNDLGYRALADSVPLTRLWPRCAA
jgi:lysophospholipase L1-like esterase